MTKARRLGVVTPVLYAVDTVMHTLTFEYVEGPSVKDILLGFGLVGVDEERMADITTQIGNAIGKLHDGGLVHGDLTTSNMLLRSSANQLVNFFSLFEAPVALMIDLSSISFFICLFLVVLEDEVLRSPQCVYLSLSGTFSPGAD